ncbi:hypothetical protein F4861DRAFT_444061 [Xylaria intraflava]|nr:hypothetical protein F4861DRAFT_444061 [Xylaria intraflava]
MALPEPLVPLTGGCTVIFDNTLYSYSAAGFQSLKLTEGAAWEMLPGGVSVDGGVCVGSTPNNISTAGLFIVGGKSSDANYAGLQKFTYSMGEWETITPQVPVTKNRVYHSAAYLNSTQSLLVYAGSTDEDMGLSQQTFSIGTSEPYGVLAYQSDISPPGVAPLLLPWSETQVALIGGSPWNTQVALFDTTAVSANGVPGAWVSSGITLAEPLPKNTTVVKGVIIEGDDGSKHLFTFDPTTSPNMVNRTVLLGTNGTPVTQASPVSPGVARREAEGGEEATINERDLLAGNWPPYNSTLAPTLVRTDYAVATDPSGLVVISGGNTDQPLCIFNAKANSWENSAEVLGAEPISVQSVSSADSISASSSLSETSVASTVTSAASTTDTASTTDATSTTDVASSTDAVSATSAGTTGNTVTRAASMPTASTAAAAPAKHGLTSNAVLGITLGSVFGAIILVALVILLMKCRQRKRTHAEAGHARRASGMPQQDVSHEDLPPVSSGYLRGHGHQNSQGSLSSLAIFGNPLKPTLRKGSSERKRMSGGSAYSKEMKYTISRPQPQPQMSTQPAFLTRTGQAPLPPQPVQPKPRTRQAVDSIAVARRSSGWNRYWSGGSSSIMGISGNRKSRPETEISYESSQYSDTHRLTQDSATVPPLYVPVEGRPSMHHVSAGSPTISHYTPTASEGLSGRIEERPVSPVSASSGYSSGITSSVHENWDATAPKKPWGSDRAPSSAYSSGTVHEGLYPAGLGVPPLSRGISRQPQLEVASMSTDMSWLNLGDNKNEAQDNNRSRR